MTEIEAFEPATSQIAQTTLRSVPGRADLDELLAERDRLNENLQQIIDEQTGPWGIKVSAALREASDDNPGALRGLGVLLRGHLDLEERELFVRIAAVRGELDADPVPARSGADVLAPTSSVGGQPMPVTTIVPAVHRLGLGDETVRAVARRHRPREAGSACDCARAARG